MLIHSRSIEDNRGKTRANLPAEHIFGFFKTFQTVTKGLGLELQLKTSK